MKPHFRVHDLVCTAEDEFSSSFYSLTKPSSLRHDLVDSKNKITWSQGMKSTTLLSINKFLFSRFVSITVSSVGFNILQFPGPFKKLYIDRAFLCVLYDGY